MNKDGQRKELKAQLDNISENDFLKKSNSLSHRLNNILKVLYSKNYCKCLGVFSPIQKEPAWFNGIKELKFDFALPKMLPEELMEFHKVSFKDIPSAGISFDGKSLLKPDVLLIPGIGFDRTGNRLGRGKGYYDRYLEHFNGVTIGIAFQQQIVEIIATDDFDRKIDYLVTEEELITIKDKFVLTEDIK